MTAEIQSQRLSGPHPGQERPALLAMLEARSVAIVGASARPGSFGARMLAEVGKSAARPAIYPVNPRYRELDGRRCYPRLADLPE
ncbi:MAG TPA: CoA-binding protein, partial [Streptosporangiaceae bacterium]